MQNATKEVTLSLFALTEADGDITESIKEALKVKTSVVDRLFDVGDEKVCAMHADSNDDFLLMHVGKYEKDAPVDVILNSDKDLKKESTDVGVVPPTSGSDFLKCQAVALFCGNAAIVVASDGRSYSLVWSFVHKLLGNVTFIPVHVFSDAIEEAINNNGIKSIKISGLVKPESVRRTIMSSDLKKLIPCVSEDNNAVKINIKFVPEKNVKELFCSFLSSERAGSTTVFEDDSGLFSIEAETNSGEKIKKDGFCRSKKVKLDRYGSFVYRKYVYAALVDWFLDLNKKNDWPSE